MRTPLSTNLVPAAGDPIFAAGDAARLDTRANRLDLVVGLYVDETGAVPVPASVVAAERQLAESGGEKRYLPIAGDPAYTAAVRGLLFAGTDNSRVELLGTPGGTGAVRIALELVARLRPAASLILPDPTWPNHPSIAAAAGIPVRPIAHRDATGAFDLAGHLAAIGAARPGDAILLHAACHNPTGVDPDDDAWGAIAAACGERGIIPVLDLAYQGLGDGLAADARGLRTILASGIEFLAATSASKMLGLYGERVGTLLVGGATPAAAAMLAGHARNHIRAAWSNPPRHGEALAALVLTDPALRAGWERELEQMRHRLAAHRTAFVGALADVGLDGSRIATGRGLFAYLDLADSETARLRETHAIHTAPGGRVNLASLPPAAGTRLAAALVTRG